MFPVSPTGGVLKEALGVTKCPRTPPLEAVRSEGEKRTRDDPESYATVLRLFPASATSWGSPQLSGPQLSRQPLPQGHLDHASGQL